MRILAIRGANLASLKGTFEVDLQKPPLCHLGLFAIAGPVGAGKSTLLDAMCLALFNRTPRLSGRGGSPLVKDGEALRANDPKSLVRRGAASAFAEVDFSGTDGRTWRARWTVRRARGQAFGRLQDEAMSLVDVANDNRVGDGKEDTLREIREHLGLTFDECCRSVLLAQGGFSSFLKAKADERAELLEKITGTDLYSALSMQAHNRARDEDIKLKVLEDELAAMPVADALARASLEDTAATADHARMAAAARVDEAEAWRRHHERAQHIASALLEAETVLAACVLARRESAASDSVFALERAWPLRPLSRALAEAAVARERAEHKSVAAVDDERRARGTVESMREHRARADEALAHRARDLADAEPALARAVVLDEQILRAGAAEVVAAHQRANGELVDVDGELTGVRTSRGIAAADLHRAEEVLAREPTLVPLIPGWTSLLHDLGQLAAAHTEVAGALAILRAAERNRDEAHARQREALASAERARTDRELARAHLASLLPTVDLDDAASVIAEAAGEHMRRDALKTALARCVARITDLDEALTSARVDESAAHARASDERVARDVAARQVAQLAHAAERALLVDGEPCPVCGSADHSAVVKAPRAPADDDALARARSTLADHDVALQSHSEARAAAAARGHEVGRAKDDAERERERVDAELADAPPALAKDDVDRARAGLRSARTAEAHARRADADVAEHAGATLVEEQAFALHARAAENAARARDDRARSLAERLGSLVDDVSLADPRALVARLKSRVEGLRNQQHVATAARAALAQSEPHLRALEQRRAACAEREESLRGRASLAQAREAELIVTRRTILHGEAAADVRGRLTSALEEARAGAADAALSFVGAEVRAHEAELRAGAAVVDADATAKAHEQARLDLDNAARAAAVLPDELQKAAVLPDDALEDARAAVRVLDDAVARAEAVVAERERARLDHAAAPVVPSSLDVDDARAALGSATEQWAAARAALAHDDAAKRRADALLPTLAAQRACTLTWQKLADVIGSADGARFRVFAQSLTLDALLVHANAQLAILAPRYLLERAHTDDKRARFDLDLVVVDRESGDEPRGVGSLSGGETFLVSLALALGLSSLSAARTSVESLFIDEGFSSLDGETLEAALAALEALRATGRQIGVISHVPALVERIGAQVRVVPLGGGKSRVDISHIG